MLIRHAKRMTAAKSPVRLSGKIHPCASSRKQRHMNRLAVISWIAFATLISLKASGQDSVQVALDRSKATYQTEKDAYHSSIVEAFDKREEAARKTGDKKLVDQVKGEKTAYEKWHAVPNNVAASVSKRRAASRTRMEAAFGTAIKSYVRSKNDEMAATIEKELLLFRGEDWPHLDLEAVKFNSDSFEIKKGVTVSTREDFSGPLEINVVARTEKENIRLQAPQGAQVIFNWEVNPNELRVNRPDGGSLATASVTPLKPETWYRLRWRITDEGMQIFVNDQMIFAEKKDYSLTSKSPVKIQAVNSLIEVRDFHVIPLKKD
jgi:hypothetical protein